MNEDAEIKYLNLEEIIPNRMQPRTEFDEEKLNELSESIKQYGIINPIMVRPIADGKYEIVAGERRYRAAGMVGLTKVPVRIQKVDDKTSAELAVIENIHRQDLSAMEEAKSYRKLLDINQITQEQLAQRMGRNQSTIANKMRLLNLCEEAQEALEKNQISERHARSLLQLKNINDQRDVLEKIINEKMTVKATDAYIKEMLQTKTLEFPKEIPTSSKEEPQSINNDIYGNDSININELNLKEEEKGNDNMNNNEQNIQLNQTMPQSEVTNQNPQPDQTIPAFGDRFFPSLEDEPTNINLSNNTFNIPNPMNSQPMMENLVEQPQMPNGAPEQTIPNPQTFVNQDSSDTFFQQAPASQPLPTPGTPPTFVAPPLSNEFSQNNDPLPTFAAPIINPIAQEPQAPTQEMDSFFQQAPGPQPMDNYGTPQQMYNAQFSQDFNIGPQPMESPVLNEPVIPEAVANPGPSKPIETEIPSLDDTKHVDTINAINALKNLALSIESIGYKLTFTEEDNQEKYKITIEIKK